MIPTSPGNFRCHNSCYLGRNSTTFHLQTDDQIEWVNDMLEQYFCHYIFAKQDN